MSPKTKGIILKITPTDSKNTYITAYTIDFGKITYIARGLNKNEAKLKTALMPFAYSRIISSPSAGEPVITRAELLEDFYPKDNSFKQRLAFYFIDLVDRLTEDRVKDKNILLLLVSALSLLKKKHRSRFYLLMLAYFPLKLAYHLGYFPKVKTSSKTNNFVRLVEKKPFSYIKRSSLSETSLRKIFNFANLHLIYASGINPPKTYLSLRSLINKNN